MKTAKPTKDELLALVRNGARQMTWSEKLRLLLLLSLPAMIAQISSVVMQIIDAAMLGHLGTREAATVGLVSTSIWLFGGLTSAFAAGFAVQVAHSVGAENDRKARDIVRQGIASGLVFSSILAIIGCSIAPWLPVWLGADEGIRDGASEYFTIVMSAMPVLQMNTLAASSLRCSGNVKLPSMLNAMMCGMDIVFNYIFIYMLDMGTAGAAWGTFLAYFITMSLMVYNLVARDRVLNFLQDDTRCEAYRPQRTTLHRALVIGFPISLERSVMCGAHVMISGIIAPLGNVAIAANTFGVNIESLCYMPGNGVGEAATTLVGQSLGAKRKDLMRSFAWLSMCMGMVVMTLMGVAMWVFAPQMMGIVTTDAEVISLGAEVLRIEAWAEPMFAASIVAYGVFVGTGRTVVPSIMNVFSIWVVRLSLSLALAPIMGLRGVWIAMCAELCFRGLIFMVKLRRDMMSKKLKAG